MFESLYQRLIVSCQASKGEAFHDPISMARFARAAQAGGAAGIRCNSPEDTLTITQTTGLPTIAIQKRMQPDGRVLITPTFEDAQALALAGASIIAIDCTVRGQRTGSLDRVRRVTEELHLPVMADIATLEEAEAAVAAGAAFVGSTMRGYTDETAGHDTFEPDFISALRSRVNVPVLAEGHISRPEEAAAALRAGAYAVIIGTAITRPHVLTADFANAMARETLRQKSWVLGIDLGGTNTKAGLVSATGELRGEFTSPTPANAGAAGLMEHLNKVARRGIERAGELGITPAAIGVATAGWVNPSTGAVVYASDNLPGWTGTRIADQMTAATSLPVAVENDANACAVAESVFGAGRGVDCFVAITLGTGIGGGCYVGGHLNRGANFMANALGHLCIEAGGIDCTCGGKGCLEAYTNAAALVRYAGPGFASAEDVVRAANTGDAKARAAIETYANYLAFGLATMAHMIDPQTIILAGGIAQNNPLLVAELNERLARLLIAARYRKLRLEVSTLGYYAGAIGAAAVAFDQTLSSTSR